MAENLSFGVITAEEMVAKAERELARLKSSDKIDRADHAMNAALTISHLTDWIYRAGAEKGLDFGQWPEFADAARNESEEVALLTDIANATKHYELTRAKRSDAASVGEGSAIFYKELTFSDAVAPEMPREAKVTAIRTIIDDDEIIGFETVIEGQVIKSPKGQRVFEEVCYEALEFWKAVLAIAGDGKIPSWVKSVQNL